MSTCAQTLHEQFNQAFLASSPDIAAEIQDRTFRMPSWFADLYELAEWTSDQNTMQELEFRGALPEYEQGFDRWKQLAQTAGCAPCTDDCSYNWTQFGGYGFNRRMISLMRREFRGPDYCVNEIRSTHEYAQVFGKAVENLYEQSRFFKEFNIGQNFLTSIAQKLVVDGSGIRGNKVDPYSYPSVGTTTQSKLNVSILTRIYEALRRRPAQAVPFDIVDGRPLYAISASDEVIDNIYLEDANARQDLRFSSASDALLARYNFMSSIRGQFINCPVLYPRRANIDAVTHLPVFEAPVVNGIPAEIGYFSDLNPAWESATHEEVLIYPKSPFKLFYRNPLTTLGQGTEFGPAGDFLTTWLWVNIQTPDDEFKRSGHFSSQIEIALSTQWSPCIYALLVPRMRDALLATYWGVSTCPPAGEDCSTNNIPTQGCPCPLLESVIPNPMVAGRYFFTFAVPVDADPEDTVTFGINNGGYLQGTVQSVSADGLNMDVAFGASVALPNCQAFTTVYCTSTLKCSSMVLETDDTGMSFNGQFSVILNTPIKADAPNDVVVGYLGDGSQANFTVVSVDMTQNKWVLQYAAGSGPTVPGVTVGTGGETPEDQITLPSVGINCDRNGVIKLCVPPSTDSTCPACSAPVLTVCE